MAEGRSGWCHGPKSLPSARLSALGPVFILPLSRLIDGALVSSRTMLGASLAVVGAVVVALF
jgi:drug/metabolite transporter (DMT)-like permease